MNMRAIWNSLKSGVRKEIWLALVVFPATFLVGFVIQFLFDSDMQQMAGEHQRQLAADLFAFNPIFLLWKIVQTTISSLSDWWERVEQGWIMVAELPIVIGRIPFALIGDVWETGTTLSAIIVTIAFLLGALIGFPFASAEFPNANVFVIVIGAGFALLIGSVICTVLWVVIWLALLLFGWFLVFAGYCAAVGGALTSVGIAYAGFRASRLSETKLDSASPR